MTHDPAARSSPANRHHKSFVFEATTRCNHDCLHCYNVWKNPRPYPQGELPTDETLALLGKMLDETGARLVSLSGGEPLLRPDLFEITGYLAARDVKINLITNGSMLDAAAINRLIEHRVSVFELPLFSASHEIHDAMSGAADAFDAATLAIAELKAARQGVVAVFVASRMNLHTWRRTAELAVALGVDAIMFNRFNPGGRGLANMEKLQASPRELEQALDEAEAISNEYGIQIFCSIAMPPCAINRKRYKRVGFGFCPLGTERAYYTLDSLGNLRPCNHSATILGNIRDAGFWDMVDGPVMRAYLAARPEFCADCEIVSERQCGCKAAAEVCCGSPEHLDPFVAAFAKEVVKNRL